MRIGDEIRGCLPHAVAARKSSGAIRLFLLLSSVFLLAFSPQLRAQQVPNNYPKLTELLQYQHSKATHGTRWAPFRKYAMRRIRLPETLPPSDDQLWGYHTELPDSTFSPSKPLTRQLRPHGPLGFAAIDHPTGSIEIVFWDKRIYRHYADGLSRIGYTLASHTPSTNTLPFRKADLSIHVDITIWPDCYILVISG